MKTLIRLRQEANERAAKNAMLSTEQKLEKAYYYAAQGTLGCCQREIARLEARLKREKHDSKIAKDAQDMAVLAENKRREANRIKALNEAKTKRVVIVDPSTVGARKR